MSSEAVPEPSPHGHPAASVISQAASRPAKVGSGTSVLETRLNALLSTGVVADYCVCDASGAILLSAQVGTGVLEQDLRSNPCLAGQFRAAISINAEGGEPCGSSPTIMPHSLHPYADQVSKSHREQA